MSDSAKLQALKERFEILKDTCLEDTLIQLSVSENIIAATLNMDVEEGMKMWEYVLTKYYGCEHTVDYHFFTDYVVQHTDDEALKTVFKTNKKIRDYVFLLDPYESHLDCSYFICSMVYEEEFELSEELISLLMRNNNGENDPQQNLYQVLHTILINTDTKWQISSAGIDFLQKYIPMVKDKIKRADLEVCMIDVVDSVENGADKGPMSFSLFTSDEGYKKFMDDRMKKDSYNDFMAERETKKASAGSSSAKEEKQINEKSLDEYKKELDSLIGLDAVKNEIDDLTNLIRIQRLRKERGYANVETSQHLVFTGNPGTGKTTVARLVGKIYHALGYLSKGHFVEVDRSGLVAGYVGQTAIKTQEVIKSALGGVLFIDEAYALAVENIENDFGKEAIETILKAMEDNRDDFVVIVAGYDELMHKFINSNPGLKSRFNKYIHFPDYTGNEMYGIFKSLLDKNEYSIAKNADVAIKSILNQVYDSRDNNFGNGRTVRNYFEQLIEAHASRIVKIKNPTETDLILITIDDVREVFEYSGYEIFESMNDYSENDETDPRTWDEPIEDDEEVFVYCGVHFHNNGNIYHYRTDDNTIKIGDEVLVPVGNSTKLKTGTVASIEYHTRATIPYPLYKTKAIAGKVEEEN
ncbi:MAG: AAA family ATPase [Clostridia bacterium]|nr:AAA family ATPase [Clostridia bacterium]